MDILRQPRIMHPHSQIVQIDIPVLQLDFKLITHVDRAALCQLDENSLKNHSVIGLLGIQLYENEIYPLFKHGLGVKNVETALEMIHLQRGDFALFPDFVLSDIDNTNLNLTLCDGPAKISYTFYSYILKSHQKYIPAIESAYKKTFNIQ